MSNLVFTNKFQNVFVYFTQEKGSGFFYWKFKLNPSLVCKKSWQNISLTLLTFLVMV